MAQLGANLQLYVENIQYGGGGVVVPTVEFEQTGSTTSNEAALFSPLTVTLSEAAAGAVVVPFSVVSSTGAARGTEFQLRTGPDTGSPVTVAVQFNIPAGNTSATLYYEALLGTAETVVFELEESVQDPAGGVVLLDGALLGGQLTHTVDQSSTSTVPEVSFTTATSFIDDDEPLTFDLIRVTMNQETLTAADVTFSLTGTATEGTDYDIFPSPPATIPINASPANGQPAFRDLGFDPEDVDEDKTVIITLDSVTGGDSAVINTAANVHTVTIRDTAAPPTDYEVIYASGLLALYENNPNSVAATISLANGDVAPLGGIHVDFSYAEGGGGAGAVEGIHFVYSPGSATPTTGITIPAGFSAASFYVEVPTDGNGDPIPDPDPTPINNTGVFTLDAVSFNIPQPPATVAVGTPSTGNLIVFDEIAPPSGANPDGVLETSAGAAIPGLAARVSWAETTPDIYVSPCEVEVTHAEAVPGGGLSDLVDRAIADGAQPQGSSQAKWAVDWFEDNDGSPNSDLRLAIRLAARIWEYENSDTAPFAMGTQGTYIVKIKIDNRASDETISAASNLSAGDTLRLPAYWNENAGPTGGVVSVNTMRWFGTNGDSINWDDEYTTGSYGDEGPAANFGASPNYPNMIRDLVLYGRVDPAVTGYISAAFAEVINMRFEKGLNDKVTYLFDNLIFARLRWTGNTGGADSALDFSKNETAVTGRGFLRMYDCQIRAWVGALGYGQTKYPNGHPQEGEPTPFDWYLRRMWNWGMSMGYPMAVDFRTATNAPVMFGPKIAREHCMYVHAIVGSAEYAAIAANNFVNLENDPVIPTSGPGSGPGGATGAPWRTFFQAPNRKDNIPRDQPNNGRWNIIRHRCRNIGIEEGASAITIWGFDGTVYTRDIEFHYDGTFPQVPAGQGTFEDPGSAGGIKFVHDYGHGEDNAGVPWVRQTYPLPEGGGYTGTGFGPRMYNTTKWICDGYVFACVETSGKSAISTVGVEQIEIISFDIQTFSGLDTQWRFNVTGNSFSQQYPGRMFTKSVDLSGLRVPTAGSDPQGALYPAADFANYPGWVQTGNKLIQDGFLQNWNKIKRNALSVKNDSAGVNYLNAWTAVVAEQHAQAASNMSGDMTGGSAGALAWQAASGGLDNPIENLPQLWTFTLGNNFYIGSVVGEGIVNIAIIYGPHVDQNNPAQVGGSTFVDRRITFSTANGTALENTHFVVSDTSPIEVVFDWDEDEYILNQGSQATRPFAGAGASTLGQNLVYYVDITGLEPVGGEAEPPVTFDVTRTFNFQMTAADWKLPYDGPYTGLSLGSPTNVTVNIVPYIGYPQIHVQGENAAPIHEIDVADLPDYVVNLLRRVGNAESLNLQSTFRPVVEVTVGTYSGTGVIILESTQYPRDRDVTWPANSASDTGRTMRLRDSGVGGTEGENGDPTLPIPVTGAISYGSDINGALFQLEVDLTNASAVAERCRSAITPTAGFRDKFTLNVRPTGTGTVRPGAHNTGLSAPGALPLIPSSSTVVVQSGQGVGQESVVENQWLVGAGIIIDGQGAVATNIIIRNCLIDVAGINYGIDGENGLFGCTNVQIEDCEIFDSGGSSAGSHGIRGTGYTVVACHLHDLFIGIDVDGGDVWQTGIRESYFTAILSRGIRWFTTPGAIVGNYVEMPHPGSAGCTGTPQDPTCPASGGIPTGACLEVNASASISILSLLGNWWNGGVYTLNAAVSGTATVTMDITNNVFNDETRLTGLWDQTVAAGATLTLAPVPSGNLTETGATVPASTFT